MTSITFYKTPSGDYRGFCADGHVGLASAGEDVVCAAISVLTINTINAIDQLTNDRIEVVQDKKRGRIRCDLSGETGGALSKDATLLMKAYEMGAGAIAAQYREVRCNVETPLED